jgi:ketosteroid isomerase-like protein
MPAYTPRKIHFIFERAFNSGDVEEILDLYEPGAVLVSGGHLVSGHDGLRRTYTALVASRGQMKLETRGLIESGEGLAVLHGAWSLDPPAGTHGLSTEVVRRQPDGSWKFVIDNPYTPI